jgi:hypothetical protein
MRRASTPRFKLRIAAAGGPQHRLYKQLHQVQKEQQRDCVVGEPLEHVCRGATHRKEARRQYGAHEAYRESGTNHSIGADFLRFSTDRLRAISMRTVKEEI